jgi:hypothetical protein
MRTREQIHPFVTPALRKRLGLYASRKGATQSSVVEAALLQYLDAEVTDRALILRRLDRLTRAAARQQRDIEVLEEAFAVFVQIWFAHTPRLPEDAKASAKQVAMRRYAQYVDHVAQQLAGGRSFSREIIAEFEEVDEADTDVTAPGSQQGPPP